MTSNGLISVFRSFPKQLFRVNNGRYVKVRAQQQNRNVYDIVAQDGRVEPKALNPHTYIAPNGASMRPNSPYQQSLVSSRFRGPKVIVYAIARGTQLPDDLVLVHERSDHYSLQPGAPMSVDDLYSKITDFMWKAARAYTREQWLEAFPRATEESKFHSYSRGKRNEVSNGTSRNL
ncbi:hypothetical protein GGR58DRAFT_524912 [Xylaria digitata]|nr:hypothetical protein GGR58DRAFT_524912 [Xylaria digitata]